MSVIDYSHRLCVTSSTGLPNRLPVALTVPSAFYSLQVSPTDNCPRSPSPPRSGSLQGHPRHTLPVISSLSPQIQLATGSKGRELYPHYRGSPRYHSPSPPSPPSPSRQHPPSYIHRFDLNNSFPPSAYSQHHQQFHVVGVPESPLSSNSTLTPEHDLDQTENPEMRFSSKISLETSSILHDSTERGRLERFPPAKRFIRALPSTPSESEMPGDIVFSSKHRVDSTKSDNSDDNDIEDETRRSDSCSKEVDLSFAVRSAISTSPHSPYLTPFPSSLPSSSPGSFPSSLFPVSFVTSQYLKPNAESSPHFLKRRHSTNNPIVVDSSIPFTTYLHNLTLTLQQSAARARSTSSHADSFSEEEKEEHSYPIDVSKPTYHIEPKDSPKSLTLDVVNAKEKYSKITEEDKKGQELFLKSDDDEEHVHSLDESVMKQTKENRKRKLYLTHRPASSLFKTDTKLRHRSRDERIPLAHPLSAPILNSTAFNMSPDSPLINQTALHSHHLFPQPQQQQSHSLAAATNMPEMALASMRSPRSPRIQHPHLSQAIQFPSFYSKLFPPFTTSPNPSHQNLANSLSGPVQALGNISSSPNRLNSLFHPAFLNMGNLNMRRAPADKPPPVKKYKCDVCQKAFSRSNTLVTHKRIHTGDKPFKCEICGRAFRQPGNLTRHRLTHTTHKPYVCHVCNKAFNRASNLNTHIRTHSSFRHFNCTGCPKNLNFKPDMGGHVYSQNGERPFKCDVCGRGFAHSSTLATHRRTHSTADI